MRADVINFPFKFSNKIAVRGRNAVMLNESLSGKK